MKLKVTKDLCEIKENEVWNVGDYNVHTVQVELSPEFNGLVNKVRYFVEDNSYDMLITDNVAQVPYEATVMEGTIKIGVYGYDADTDILVQSTSPVNKYISSGTYTGEADNTKPLTPTDKQQIESAIQQNTDDIIVLQNNKQDVLISGENIKTINNESILGSGNIETGGGGSSDYEDLENLPKINNVELVGNKSLSDLGIQPAGNYITKAVDDLENYYKKSETYTQTEINNLISAISTMSLEVVQTLPTQDISTTTIYLVPKTTAGTNDAYDEYIYVSNAWEHIGSTDIDLTNYVTNTDYANSVTGGVIKIGASHGTSIAASGSLTARTKTYEEYSSSGDYMFVGKGTLENVIVGKELVTNQDLNVKQNIIDNTLTTINKTIPTAINEVNSIAKGANQAVGYSNYQTMITALNNLNNDEYIMGQNIYIVSLNVPDLWISEVMSSSSTYTYVDDATFINELSTNGYVQVGYYKLSALETQKVDLTNYIKNTDYATSTKPGVFRYSNGAIIGSTGYISCSPRTFADYGNLANNYFISKGTLENVLRGYGLID